MKQAQYDFQKERSKSESSSLIEKIEYYKQRWIWFFLSVVFCCGGAFVFLYFAPPEYQVNASVLIKSNDSSNNLNELSAFSDLSITPENRNLEDECELLKSRKLTAQVVQMMQLNIVFQDENHRFKNDLFPKSPLKLVSTSNGSTIDTKKGNYQIQLLSNERFLWKDKVARFSGSKKLGASFESSLGKITLLPTRFCTKKWFGREIALEVQPFNAVVDYYQKAIDVKQVNDESNVLVISMKHSSPQKAVEIINTLITMHNEDALLDKNLVAKRTAKFITDRIDYISKELMTVESDVEQFKTKYQLTDVLSDAAMYAELGSENEKNLIQQSTQLELSQYMLETLKSKTEDFDLVPTNVGITDQTINDLSVSYNNLILERNKILKSSSEKNPVIQNLDAQLASLKTSLVQSLKNQTTFLGYDVRSLKNQDRKLSGKISEAPRFEREFRSMQRQQQVKESLYLYLLQKREETAIALAVNEPNIKVLNSAYCNGQKVSPNKKVILAGAGFIGLLLPFLFFYFRLLVDTKIRSKRDLEYLELPFLCELPLHKGASKLLTHRNSNTAIIEAFRLLRSNLSFMLSTSNHNSKCIFVSSTISSEGKTLTALNLAASYALLGKKVLLVGMDLRAPKFTQYMQMPFQKGITSYIVDESIDWPDLITKVPDFECLDVISSGPIPPNPAELITHKRVDQLFAEAREKYDFIIVDTAPVGLVSDTLLIAEKADVFLYVVRVNVLDKRMLEIISKLTKEKRLGTTALVLNGVDLSKGQGSQYGYGYGYGLPKKQNWFQRTFRKS